MGREGCLILIRIFSVDETRLDNDMAMLIISSVFTSLTTRYITRAVIG